MLTHCAIFQKKSSLKKCHNKYLKAFVCSVLGGSIKMGKSWAKQWPNPQKLENTNTAIENRQQEKLMTLHSFGKRRPKAGQSHDFTLLIL